MTEKYKVARDPKTVRSGAKFATEAELIAYLDANTTWSRAIWSADWQERQFPDAPGVEYHVYELQAGVSGDGEKLRMSWVRSGLDSLMARRVGDGPTH